METNGKFSDVQLNILKGLGMGRNVKEIAFDLGRSEKTVEFHAGTLYKLTGCNSRAGLVRFAIENGLVKPGEKPADPKPPLKSAYKALKNSNDLAQALLEGASKAAAGTADVLQLNALCNCSDALCRLAVLQMRAEERASKLPWLSEDETKRKE